MNSIQAHFRPLQPSVDHLNQDTVVYEETRPCSDLRDTIYCYWHLRSKHRLEQPFKYRVVSDGCIDILWEQNKRDKIFITGFSTKYIEFELGEHFDYIGIRFLPAGFPTLFDIPASRLANNFIYLKEISSQLHLKISELNQEPSNLEEIAKTLNSFFDLHKQTLDLQLDRRFLNAMDQLLVSKGDLNLKDLDVGISERQLRRLFEFYVGTAPKTFLKVVRFQNLLNATPSWRSLKDEKTYYDQGYYDQAHFIKEFKDFYGVTPGRAFGH